MAARLTDEELDAILAGAYDEPDAATTSTPAVPAAPIHLAHTHAGSAPVPQSTPTLLSSPPLRHPLPASPADAASNALLSSTPLRQPLPSSPADAASLLLSPEPEPEPAAASAVAVRAQVNALVNQATAAMTAASAWATKVAALGPLIAGLESLHQRHPQHATFIAP